MKHAKATAFQFSHVRTLILAFGLIGQLFTTLPAADEDQFKPVEPTTAADIFGQTIRATPSRSPEEEVAGFHVPAGFAVDLIAAEPVISKPMNLAFDGKGRLWVTQSMQYPFPAKGDEVGKDAIVILEDKDRDGNFESSHVFADGLNIPIGMLPYGDGALCFSIPNIYYLRDTDQDGVCDAREVVLGPFDTTRDTHGMVNSLRMGSDGWVYACHGFNNQSTVAGKDGHSISMTSGNVFRFRPDGSRVELYTQGQVNPFGMAQDRFGFWYAADCHSKPISQLIRGGCYPSFGRPDDGLGFVPPMMDHLHGSTAIAGLAHAKDSSFPVAFQDNFFSGNVMTCRINRNRLEYQGFTAKAVEAPDLLTSDDPCFRPVDLQFGPDGHLYVADFYNKVIGHYEVPLDHPDRDRTSGRIWRIRWTGGGDLIDREKEKTQASRRDAVAAERGKMLKDKPAEIGKFLHTYDEDPSAISDPMEYRTREFQALMESLPQVDWTDTSDQGKKSARARSVQAAEWLYRRCRWVADRNDPIHSQSVLIGLRDVLLDMRAHDRGAFQEFISGPVVRTKSAPSEPLSLDSPDVSALMRVLLALKDTDSLAAALTIAEIQAQASERTAEQSRLLQQAIQKLAEFVGDSEMDRLLGLMERTSGDPISLADQVLSIAKRQQQQRGRILETLSLRGHKTLGALSQSLSMELSESVGENEIALVHWSGVPLKGEDRRDWGLEQRELAQQAPSTSPSPKGLFFSSLTLGESYTGIWVSRSFDAPKQLDFWIVGHNGQPAEVDHQKNYVSLVQLDRLGNVVKEIYRETPPRSDIAKQVSWDLSSYAGHSVQVRVVDGDNSPSFAWIGFGESNLTGLNPNSIRTQWQRISSFVDVLGLPIRAESLSGVEQLIDDSRIDWLMRLRLAKNKFQGADAGFIELLEFATEKQWMDLVDTLGLAKTKLSAWNVAEVKPEEKFEFGKALCQRCSFKEQEQLVVRWSKHRAALPLLASLCEKGILSRDSLRVLSKSWWESLPQDGSLAILALRPEPESASARLAVVEDIAGRIASIEPDLTVGAKMFADRCAVCHKLGDQGKVIGPQLDGVGTRGISRLTEDILWPDRNVDEAFRMSILLLDGGESANGLVSERTAESLMLTDQTGKQRRILVEEIEQEKHSKLSLMPGNFEEVMTPAELASLIGYLKSAATKK